MVEPSGLEPGRFLPRPRDCIEEAENGGVWGGPVDQETEEG